MLRHYSSIVVAGNNLKSALKILCLIEQRGLLVTLGIGLRSIHIALAIHHLIPMPVDYRTACYANLEYVWIVGHKRDCHESAEAPTMYTNAVGIYIRKTLEIFHTLHLVLHLFLTKLAECSLLKLLATVLRTTVVKDKEQIAFACHISLPTT